MTTIKVITEIEIANARHCSGDCPYLDIITLDGDHAIEYIARCELCDVQLKWDPLKKVHGYLRGLSCRKLAVVEEK